jgi:hypothetical protein
MQLKELVPPPEVCIKIPIGEFKDSFAVYLVTAVSMDKPFDISKQSFELMLRFAAERLLNSGCEAQVLRVICSAPTLQEIMAEMTFCNCYRVSKEWVVALTQNNTPTAIKNNNPAAAALKLWLEMKGLNNERKMEA